MINNLQVLRAFAAILVIIFHTIGVAKVFGYNTSIFTSVPSFGSFGVDIFFVISGFIISHVQYSRPKSPLLFLKNRLKRIVPLYWTLTIAVTIIFYFFSLKFNLQQSITSLLFISSNFHYDYPTLAPGWTLEYEMLFYLIFAGAITAHKYSINIIVSVMIIALVLLKLVEPIVLEFVFGMIASYFYRNNIFKESKFILLSLSVLWYLIGFYVEFGEMRVLSFGFPAALLVLSCCYFNQIKSTLFLSLGNSSYSIYLIQAFTLPLYFETIKWSGITGINADIVILACSIFTVSSGVCLYYLYEKPVSKIIKGL